MEYIHGRIHQMPMEEYTTYDDNIDAHDSINTQNTLTYCQMKIKLLSKKQRLPFPSYHILK